jgi:hypothetical protein
LILFWGLLLFVLALLTVRDVTLNCDKGWIPAFTFGNIESKRVTGKILFGVNLIGDLGASGYERRSHQQEAL